MTLILGKRDYEKSATGKYPKFTLQQLNMYTAGDDLAHPYLSIQIIIQMKCWDLFNCYGDKISKEQRNILDKEIKKEYGLHNVNPMDFIDLDKFMFDKESDKWVEKIGLNDES